MSSSASAFESLELRGVGRSFGGREALADLNLTIRAGEFIALLGPSGCGKSTALNCLAGLLPLTHGSIWIDNEQRVDVLAPEDRDFGMVFQNYALFPHLTVARNVAFGLQMRKLPRATIDKRVADALALVRLEEHANKLPGQLSGGQQQRVAIARAVVVEPRLVLMDEPLSNLDAKLRLDMRTEIRRLHQSLGLTTVYVTHDQEEALSLADRLVVLRDGRVQQVGTPEELHDHPANWHVADFMGYRNILDVDLASLAGTDARVSGHGLDLAATAAPGVGVGDDVKLAVRPSDLQLLAADEPVPAQANRIDAVVEVVEYQGREFAVDVTTSTGTRLHVRSTFAPLAGEKVRLALSPARAVVFRRDLDAAPAPASALAQAHA